MILAKFYVAEITTWKKDADTGRVKLQAATAALDDIPENQRFHRATPYGSIELHIDNPEAFAQFQHGEAFYVEFRPAPVKRTVVEEADPAVKPTA